MTGSTTFTIDGPMTKALVEARLFQIVFTEEYCAVGPFPDYQSADEYGMRHIEPKLRGTTNEWRIRPMTPPFG